MAEGQLYEQGIESASRGYALFENAVIAITVAVGAWGMWPLLNVGGVGIVSLVYAGFLVVSLGFLLRKHLCTHCHYHGRWCHCGWGVLSSGLGYEAESGNKKLGTALAGATWGVLMMGPIIGMIAAIVAVGFSALQGVLLGAFVVLVAVNFGLHVKDCRECKMRFVCGMSAAKK